MAEHMSGHVDVAVVGGGVAGAALSLALAGDGWQVVLVERAAPVRLTGTLGFDLRTSALSPGSVRLLTGLGVPAAALGHAWSAMHVESSNERECLDFAADGMLGSIAENGVLTEALWDLIGRTDAIDVVCPAQVDDLDAGVLTAGERRLRATLVVGADGGASRVRELAGGTTDGFDPGQRALVTVAATTAGDPGVAWQRFTDTGTLAFLPLGPGGDDLPCWSVVWSAPPEMVAGLEAASETAFRERLQAACGAAFGTVERVDRRVSFPLAQRFAAAHVPMSGVVLVGDAAHVVHPLAGQGANMGLRDVATLVEVLHIARCAGCAPDDRGFLREYERRRAADNLVMLAGIAAMPGLWTTGGVMRWLRGAGLAWLRGSDATRRRLTAAATR